MTCSIRTSFELQLKSFCAEHMITKVMVGVSGGVDSAVVLRLAVEALGTEKVVPVLMPYQIGKCSSEENFEDAKDLCEDLGVVPKIIHIDELVKEYEGLFSGMAFANTLARVRMMVLFGYANTYDGIVLGTCNKSEVMLGYETKFGDGACDISVLGDLWKSEVYSLAKGYGLSESFLIKPPSAELFPSQSDEAEMGFSYDTAEKYLKKIESGETEFSDRIGQKIFNLYSKTAHKRSLPPVFQKPF